MPKGHKRKNTGVGVDFKRAKHKVGKKLPQAQNATDTTVVSRSIALKEQSIALDKTGAVVTHRNLTLKVRTCLYIYPPSPLIQKIKTHNENSFIYVFILSSTLFSLILIGFIGSVRSL